MEDKVNFEYVTTDLDGRIFGVFSKGGKMYSVEYTEISQKKEKEVDVDR